ncbi:arsenate reductase (glutaredoxin) [Nitrosomonas sp.]|uniref:arsenate reductase (glutaredoxin) n=1 Tax=Nitrosomonas sp. TaxID=42353 RepID=UPI001D319F2B|nr:arsenate reductase (glutaredoxin) [Nitrosomonas sp.]MCB1949494.1 arsenate reductase (glutaredoxin) [Nitrosomonas sp.]
MSDKITIYQKPTCSKCRGTLAILDESGQNYESVNYYETPLTVDKLRELINKLGLSARDVLRKDEPAARDLDLNTISEDALIQHMVDNPDLMQRPIVVRGDKAKICRPPENVRDLL